MNDLYTLYGAEFSLYSGKARSYLRKKGVNFEEVTSTVDVYKKFIVPRTGVRYIPVVQTPDDRVIQDTTDIIDDLEKQSPNTSVYPVTPKQKLASLLIELYADEWLVIPAMHYRWNYPAANADFIYREFGSMAMPKMPGFIQKVLGKKVGNTFKKCVPKLGITQDNIPAIESSYVALLGDLESHVQQNDFLFGSKPSIGDFGLMGPLYAHLYRDPAPGKLMRKRAPSVCDWVRRMNDDSPYLQTGEFLPDDEIPDSIYPILSRMAREQMPVLLDTNRLLAKWRAENPSALEVKRFIGSHTFKIGDAEAQRLVLPYCLWMYQRSHDFYHGLCEKDSVDDMLVRTGLQEGISAPLSNRVERVNNKLSFA